MGSGSHMELLEEEVVNRIEEDSRHHSRLDIEVVGCIAEAEVGCIHRAVGRRSHPAQGSRPLLGVKDEVL